MINLALEQSYPTPYANSTLLPLLLLSLATQKNAPDTAKVFKNEYDYIVVGGGSAGSTVAGRLSELGCVNVLLLEAGKAPPLLNDVPGLARNFWFTDLDWQFKTVPQKHTGEGLENRQVIWPSGKALGGSGILNAMLYVRGNKKNYDDWEKGGADGWGYKDVLPYFKKMEDNKDPVYASNGFHGVGGPLTVETNNYRPRVKKALLNSAQDLGYNIVDPNGPQQTGLYNYQATTRNKQRCSAAKAYLVPAEDRPNLDIVPNAFVRKVLTKNGKAEGVEFDIDGFTYNVRATREVIMSAGTTNTAQLLMLSGIGPREHLEQFNIPVVADLPVGNNFQDHPGAVLIFEMDKSIPSGTEKLIDPQTVKDYVNYRSGPLASVQLDSLLAFLRGRDAYPDVDDPEYELYFAEFAKELAKTQIGLTPQIYNGIFKDAGDKPLFICLASLVTPKSIGSVRLQSANPYDPPLIDPNYFDDPDDMRVTVDAMRTCLKIASETAAMAKIGAKPFPERFPGCESHMNNTDAYLECQARSVVTTLSHQVGAAKMGSRFDETAVVDPELKVIGVDGLRVVDASVMPTVPSGNTNVPTIMIAEKASDMIKRSVDCFHSPTDIHSPATQRSQFESNCEK